MLTHLFRIAASAGVLAVAACNSTPDDFEGADNTHSNVEEGACDKLRSCCAGLGEDIASTCLTGASSGDESSCTAALTDQRASGACQ
jgi:hypothetical protein